VQAWCKYRDNYTICICSSHIPLHTPSIPPTSILTLTTKMVEEAPTWGLIRRSLFALHIELKLDESASSPTLDYEEFERVFSRLFTLIDGPGNRRKSRLTHLARDSDRKEKFIEFTITFINQRKLTPQPITRAHLRAFGGESFRRLLGAVIKSALRTETAKIKKYASSFRNEVELVESQLRGSSEVPLLTKVEENLKNVEDIIEHTKKCLSMRENEKEH